MNARKQGPYARQVEEIKPLKMFQADPIYGGGLHRADMAWAIHAASCGLTTEQIKDELLNGRDLSKKGNLKRQVEYASRTAQKATPGANIQIATPVTFIFGCAREEIVSE
jgi:hypothetical protein